MSRNWPAKRTHTISHDGQLGARGEILGGRVEAGEERDGDAHQADRLEPVGGVRAHACARGGRGRYLSCVLIHGAPS